MMVSDPWGSHSALPSYAGRSSPHQQQFEDNFNAEPTESSESNYVALDDSRSYLERLQKKLDKVQGNSSAATSRSLLAGLTSARQSHHHHFLSTRTQECSNQDQGELSSGDGLEPPSQLPHTRGLLLSERQPHLNNLLLRMAPDRVALSADELVQLLSADILDSTQISQGSLSESHTASHEKTELSAGDSVGNASTQNDYSDIDSFRTPTDAGSAVAEVDSNYFKAGFEAANNESNNS